MEIKEALSKLDHDADDQWTGDGSPRIDVIARMTGIKDVKRQDITDADPNFVRGKPNGEDEKATDETGTETGEKEDFGDEASSEDETEDVVVVTAGSVDDLADDEILEATPEDLGGDSDMIDKWLRAANNKCVELERTRKTAHDDAVMWGKRINIISRVASKLARQRDRNPNQTAIGKFLAQQNNARVERAIRAREFLASGTSAQAVLEQIAKGSKLDQAMSTRKAKPGSTRPDPRLPIRK